MLEIPDILEAVINIKTKKYSNVYDEVPIEEWVASDYYLGPSASTLYEYWKDVIIDFENGGYNELVLFGGMGTGKSHTALILIIRNVFRLSCFSPIPSYLGFDSASSILFAYLAVSVRQANLTGFGKIRRMIDSIPYFQENFPRNKNINSTLEFRNQQLSILSGSETGHFKGGDLFSGVLDEGNFQRGGDVIKFEKAQDVYTEMTNRRKLRFATDAGDPGFNIIVSSADNASSFVESRIEESKGDDSIMVVKSTTWKTRPKKYSGKTFWIFQGDKKIDPFVEDDEQALGGWFSHVGLPFMKISELPRTYKLNWIEVPIELRDLFKKGDLERALADVCGVSGGNSKKLFLDEKKFDFAFPKETEYLHPFTKQDFCISYRTPDRVEHYLRHDWKGFDPQYQYYAHIDQSITNNWTGIGVCHMDYLDRGNILNIDLMVRILPPLKPDKISIKKIREFFFYLIENKNLDLDYISYDQFQSAESLQAFENAGIECGLLSVDRDCTQYNLFVDLLLAGAIQGYFYKPFEEEFFALEIDREKRKVDHPPKGAKDVSDAIVGAAYHCFARQSMGDERAAAVRFI